jgi:hypothetical protein
MSVFAGPKIIEDGLVLYLDASNEKSYPGTGTTWFDISGNGRNCSWVSTPSVGTDTGVKYFTTLGNRCLGPASNSLGINNTSGYTIFLVVKQLSLAGAAAFKFYSPAGRGIFAHATWIDNNIYFDQGGCCSSDTRTNTASGGISEWTILVFRRFTNSSTRSIIKNNSILVTNTATASDINLNSTALDIASSDEYGGNSSVWNARLNSFVVYNRGLSDLEIQKNFEAIRGRFKL